MSYTAREYLNGLASFTNLPNAKEEAWRFSKQDKWLDKTYGDKEISDQKETQLIDTPNHIHIRNGHICKYFLPDGVVIGRDDATMFSTKNPYLALVNDLCPATTVLTCKKSLDEPLLISYTYDNSSISGSSVEIYVENGVQVEIVEFFEGASEGLVIHGSYLEMKNNASVHLRTIQNLGKDAAIISHAKHNLKPNSTLKEFYLFQGSDFHQHFIESDLYQGAYSELNALANTKASQHHLLNTVFTHFEKDTVSLQKAKELMRDNSMALFDARSIIHNEATNSNVRQENRGLLLSKDAHLHAKPHLEIFTDDLQASHGATVGELDIEALNYMQTRGISEKVAHKMLINAFIDDILSSIDNEELLKSIRNILDKGVGDEEF